MNCVFCNIARGTIKTEFIGENKTCYAIADLNPKAKNHFLVIPKEHVAKSVNFDESDKVLKDAFGLIRSVAKELKIDETGYRVITNHSKHAGQSVDHLHFHVLGGERLKEL